MNSRMGYPISGFQDRHVRPLRHPSIPRLDRPGARVLALRDWTGIFYTFLGFLYVFHPTHIRAQHLRDQHTSIWLLVIFQNGHEGSTYGKA